MSFRRHGTSTSVDDKSDKINKREKELLRRMSQNPKDKGNQEKRMSKKNLFL